MSDTNGAHQAAGSPAAGNDAAASANPSSIHELPTTSSEPASPTSSPRISASPSDVDRVLNEHATPGTIRRVESSDEFDPIPSTRNGSNSDNGANVVESFVNRTVFFDYFRHVAHKRFPDLAPEERVERLIATEPKFYARALRSDHYLKIITTYLTIGLGSLVIVKAVFF